MPTRPLLVVLSMVVCGSVSPAEPLDVPLANGSFEGAVTPAQLPAGWRLYGGDGTEQKLSVVSSGESKALLIEDGDPAAEIGLQQEVAVKPGETYALTVRVRRVRDADPTGAFAQLRFLPGDHYVQRGLAAESPDSSTEITLATRAPDGATTARIYLYTHAAPTPKVMVDSVSLQSGVELPQPRPEAAEVPPPVPPTYDKLKDLHLRTTLVADATPLAAIVASASGVHDDGARLIADAIRRATGVAIPIIGDTDPGAAVPLNQNLIVLGDRTTNRCMSALYDGFFSLLDPKYPGRGGHVLRSVHNPYGNGHNAILVGGSDPAGVRAAAELLCERIAQAPVEDGRLSLGWLMQIRLGDGLEAPRDVTKAEIWEASRGYGSSGYFGWNSISKRMALYYMTGDEFHAREVIRLSFPDAQALAEIDKIDQEMIEDKHHPLSGPYHYSAHFSVLFWDLIEESPVFSDEERLRVTNALAGQLNHRKGEGVYGVRAHKGYVGDRHGDWSAVSLYCLGRYFSRYYPAPVWDCCVQSATVYFSALKDSAWLAGSNDHLFWYNTYYEPIETYMLLSGDRAGLESGHLQQALKTQDILYTGNTPDWALNTASLAWLNKTAYLTGDSRWLHYRDRTGLDTDVLRLGQAFWPPDDFRPRPPTELSGRFTVQPMPEPMWKGRGSGLPLEQSFLWGSYRSAADDSGDFLLLDGFNGGGRNPYHTFAVLELRLNGVTALKNYHNQVLTGADGMVEPQVAMDSGLRKSAVVGQTAFASAEVPKTPFADWRRSIAMRNGHYALFVDRLDFRADSDNMQVLTTWEPVGGAWQDQEGFLRINGDYSGALPPGWLRFKALEAAYESSPPGAEHTSNLTGIGIVLLKSTAAGDWLQMPFSLPEPVSGEVFAELLNYVDRGPVRLWLDGEIAVERYEHHAAAVTSCRVSLGQRSLAAGEHSLRVETLGRQEGVDRCYVGLAGVAIRPQEAPAAGQRPVVELHPGEIVPTDGGGVVSMKWRGKARRGETKTTFYLLGQKQPDDTRPLGCAQIGPDAAALALPEPALAVAGECESTRAELAVLAEDHLFGEGLTSAGLKTPLLLADAPISADWSFGHGKLSLFVAEETALRIRCLPGPLSLDGQPVQAATGTDGMVTLRLSAGEHHLSGVVPTGLESLGAALRTRVAAALAGRDAARVSPPQVSLPERDLNAVGGTQLPGGVVDMVAVPRPEGDLLAVAEERRVHLLTAAGEEQVAMPTEGDVRVLRWWAEHELLLVGCADEKVLAFGLDGEKRWEFVSEMDPAVYAAAKQYWFKSAHPGIYGLHTGVLMNEQSQAFVGSACTLEILDREGGLLRRMPVFWGPGWRFTLIDGPAGTRQLLNARWPNDSVAAAVIDGETLSQTAGFVSVPAGHANIGGWTAQSRPRTYFADLDGDGESEVISAINGVWNRVTVWDNAGRAKHNVQFGPGEKAPAVTLADMDLCDLDGDGCLEVLVAKQTDGLVVALDHELAKLWVAALPSGPCVLRAAGGNKAIVGCLDGSVLCLGSEGELESLAKVTGRPTVAVTLGQKDGRTVAVATDAGDVKVFAAR